MSHAGDCFVRCCSRLNRIPATILCIFLFIVQACVLDYYLVKYMGTSHLAWIAGDVVVLILLVTSIVMASKTLGSQKEAEAYSTAWITWIIMHSLLASKVIVCSLHFGGELEESESFFGPNTLKTAIALGSCIFLLLLTTQHDAPIASERRHYIEELTATVFVDLLDTTDILEVLFDGDDRELLTPALEGVILGVATLNLLLPSVPLITLSKTKFGHAKLGKHMVYVHRLLLILAVNVPNLLVRLVLWHGFSAGISPFTLKNFVLIILTFYEFYEHKSEKYEEHEREKEHEHKHLEMENSNEIVSPSPRKDIDTGNTQPYVNVKDRLTYVGYGGEHGPMQRSTNYDGKFAYNNNSSVTSI